MKMRSLERNMKAISPVLAVLMMIAVAIAGSLVTYAWVMGYIGFTTEKSGQAIMIQSIAYNDASETLFVYVQNVGEGVVELNDDCLYVNDALRTLSAINPTDGIVAEKATATLQTIYPVSGGEKVTAKVTTTLGTFTEKSDYPASTTVEPVTPPPTVTRELSNEQTDEITGGFTGVEAGDLLVVMPNHRTGIFATDGETCTAAGYTTVEVASWYTSDGDRRAVALLIKTADGTESGEVTCTWGSVVTTYATIYQIYRGATTWTPGASDVDHNGGASDGSILSISGLPTSTTANVLTIGALVTRDNPGTVTMTNLGSQYDSMDDGCYTFTEFNYGDAVTDTDMSWTTAQQASGLLAQITCTD